MATNKQKNKNKNTNFFYYYYDLQPVATIYEHINLTSTSHRDYTISNQYTIVKTAS